ncbi:Carnitine O-acetyltransferase mitochondrial [Serendipita sp. 407]|nr:Carnitine O-acetyltransferase mitochondrial [Serendipita sp. 407]
MFRQLSVATRHPQLRLAPRSTISRLSSSPSIIMTRKQSGTSTVGPMLAHEDSLPGLPIPTIQSTAEKYLETTRPHLTPSEFRTTQLAVNEFISSPLVRRLQTRLEERAVSEKSQGKNNWLIEWWNDIAYMSYRDPVVVFVSYFYVHLAGEQGKGRDLRAAELLKGLLLFRDLVESQKLEPEKIKDYPLAMNSYKWLFNAARIPTAGSDTAKKYPADSHNHVVFIRKNRLYEIPVVVNGKQLSVSELESLIAKVVAKADKEGTGVPVGVCYESAQTRKFAMGRTEVIRAASSESKEWAESMLSSEKTDSERFTLFKKAVNRHLQYAAWAADGQGVDRHLFGLKRLLKEGEETPRLYEDVAFGRTNKWELSTSNLSSKWLDGWGYGEVVPDGYGLSYSIGDGYIRWTMTCLKDMSRKGKGAKELKKALEEAAEMVKALLASVAQEPKAKL